MVQATSETDVPQCDHPTSEQDRNSPGPWSTRYDGGPEGGITWVRDRDNRIICEMIQDFVENDGEVKANAHLIAAAPELYAACAEALEQLELLAKDPKDNWWCKTLQAALAKARGEPS